MDQFTKEDFKSCQPEEAGFFETKFNRKISILITRLLIKTSLTPTNLTWLSFFILCAGAYLLSTGDSTRLIIAGILIQLSYTLDCCDGEVSRLKGLGSKKGAWTDGVLDRVSELVLFIALAIGLYRQNGQHIVWIYIFFAFAALFMTHVITMITSQVFGKAQIKRSQDVGLLGRICKKLHIRPCYLRIGIDMHMMIFALGAILNQLMWINYFFISIQNVYWIALFITVLVRREGEAGI